VIEAERRPVCTLSPEPECAAGRVTRLERMSLMMVLRSQHLPAASAIHCVNFAVPCLYSRWRPKIRLGAIVNYVKLLHQLNGGAKQVKRSLKQMEI